MQALFDRQVFVLGLMVVLTFALTQGLKWAGVKPWTNKLKNERVRKAINTIIYFFPYAISLGLEFVFAIITKGEFNALVALVIGGGSHSVYGLFEMIYGVATGKIKIKKEEVKELIQTVTEDGKIDENDHPALKAFLDKIK